MFVNFARPVFTFAVKSLPDDDDDVYSSEKSQPTSSFFLIVRQQQLIEIRTHNSHQFSYYGVYTRSLRDTGRMSCVGPEQYSNLNLNDSIHVASLAKIRGEGGEFEPAWTISFDDFKYHLIETVHFLIVTPAGIGKSIITWRMFIGYVITTVSYWLSVVNHTHNAWTVIFFIIMFTFLSCSMLNEIKYVYFI